MDDTHIKAASEDQEVYEDIQNVTFEKNLYEQASTLATLSTFPMILSFLQSAATTLFSPETQERLRAELEVDKYFEALGEESLRREEETWASLKRIKSHTSVLFYIFNATEELLNSITPVGTTTNSPLKTMKSSHCSTRHSYCAATYLNVSPIGRFMCRAK